jgi:hypothetical protein
VVWAAYLLFACQCAAIERYGSGCDEPAGSSLSSLLLETADALLPPFSSHLGQLVAENHVSASFTV